MGSYWGPHFPDAQRVAARVYWDGHFPDGGLNPADFGGFGPPGSATFVLDLESGFTVTLAWVTDIIKRYGGTEQRIATIDAPKQFYRGSAVLTGDNPRRIRGLIAQYMQVGSQFLLGLAHEELTLVADAVSKTLTVGPSALTYCDWKNIGQRVVVVSCDGLSTVSGVIQSTTSTTITLDSTPGSVGNAGGKVMPAMAIYLDPQQGFSRFPVNAEQWAIDARAAIFDFAPTLATLALDPITTSAGFNGVIVYARRFGLAGNGPETMFAMSATGTGTGQLVEADGEVQFNFQAGVTTIGDLNTALNLSSYVKLGGTYTPTDTIAAGDAFGLTNLTGGSAGGAWGNGASVTTYDSRPVWDRPIQVDGSGVDSVHALIEVLDMGGVPYAIGSADFADWGRHVKIERSDISEYQWLKLFLSTVRGRQRAFWLPTYRNDLSFVSKSTNVVTVEGPSAEDGDFFAWWPYQRDRLQIEQTDGTITRVQITNAVDNANGTVTLTIGTTLSGVAVSRISWLELCRFELDEFNVVFSGPKFSMQTIARVVRA